MKRHVVTALIIGCTALVLAGTGYNVRTEPAQTDEVLTAPKAINPLPIAELIYNGRSDSALAILDAPEYAGSSDPLVYLLRARALRDQLDDEDDSKDPIKQDAQPILAQIDTAITLSEQALEHDASDPIYHYYRGRAYLGRAQIQTITRSYWGAGRSAGHAKSSLEKFLKLEPDNADAQGDLGLFLYFADTLPGVVKFMSKLLHFPSGNRERGLEMLQYASTHEAIFYFDYRAAVAVIDILFEGRFPEGTARMVQMINDFPQHTRLVEPLGVLSPLDPLNIRAFEILENRAVETRQNMVDAMPLRNLVERIGVHRAYTDMYFRSPNSALESFTAFLEDPIDRPDWAVPLALINRGQLYAKSGRTDEALVDFGVVLSGEEMGHFHDLAKTMINSLSEPWKVIDLDDLEFIAAIYDGNLETAEAGLKEYGRIYGRDVIYYFYLGEIEVFAQDFARAKRAYETCLSIRVKGGDQSYQMLSALRLAEILGQEEKYGDAKSYVAKARGYVHVGFLFDFMIHSREHYFELMDKGTLTTPSPLLVKKPANGSGSSQAVSQ